MCLGKTAKWEPAGCSSQQNHCNLKQSTGLNNHQIIISLSFYKSLIPPSVKVNKAPVNISGLAQRNSILRIYSIQFNHHYYRNMQEIRCDCLLFTHSYHQAIPTPRASCNYSCSEVSDRFPPEKTPTECVLQKHIHSVSLLLKPKPCSQCSASCQEKSAVIWHNAKCMMQLSLQSLNYKGFQHAQLSRQDLH